MRALCLLMIALAAVMPQRSVARSLPAQEFVQVREGAFYLGNTPYRYVGANFWYGALLASEGQGGDRQRLHRELDLMQRQGITNLRVLVGAEAVASVDDVWTLPDGRRGPGASHVRPVLQTAPGVYNDTLLRGLDYLLVELERRDMKAVLYLNNSWEWSGGFGAYLEWAGAGPVAMPSPWDEFQAYQCQFVQNATARRMAADHTRYIVSRVNSLTGRPYRESPAIMAWEIANEPRAFSRRPEVKEAFADWIHEQARLIKSLDPRHLVTTGSEGRYGCENDTALFRRIHTLPEIDYACIHIWPYNFAWIGRYAGPTAAAIAANGRESVAERVPQAIERTDWYAAEACRLMRPYGRPVVIEEFGYPRDGYAISPQSSVTARDRYYAHIFSLLTGDHCPEGATPEDMRCLAGCNFWSWTGTVQPAHPYWQEGDPYTGDPSQEEQGLYSVFSSDQATLSLIRRTNRRLEIRIKK